MSWMLLKYLELHWNVLNFGGICWILLHSPEISWISCNFLNFLDFPSIYTPGLGWPRPAGPGGDPCAAGNHGTQKVHSAVMVWETHKIERVTQSGSSKPHIQPKTFFLRFWTRGNGFFAPGIFPWISEISGIWSRAGELWTDLRPAGKLPGRISMDFQQPRQ